MRVIHYLGETTRRLRLARDMTQAELGDATGLGERAIREIEKPPADVKHGPGVARVQILAEFFGCSFGYLLGDNPRKRFEPPKNFRRAVG